MPVLIPLSLVGNSPSRNSYRFLLTAAAFVCGKSQSYAQTITLDGAEHPAIHWKNRDAIKMSPSEDLGYSAHFVAELSGEIASMQSLILDNRSGKEAEHKSTLSALPPPIKFSFSEVKNHRSFKMWVPIAGEVTRFRFLIVENNGTIHPLEGVLNFPTHAKEMNSYLNPAVQFSILEFQIYAYLGLQSTRGQIISGGLGWNPHINLRHGFRFGLWNWLDLPYSIDLGRPTPMNTFAAYASYSLWRFRLEAGAGVYALWEFDGYVPTVIGKFTFKTDPLLGKIFSGIFASYQGFQIATAFVHQLQLGIELSFSGFATKKRPAPP